MRRLFNPPLWLVLVVIPFLVRAEVPESGVPDFAAAKISIAQMGVFLEKNADFASQVIPNVGPLAKIALANLLFKLPVDESLNFEGPVQIYIVPPLTFTASQDVATVLPVSDAEKVKKNAMALYGDPAEKEGAMVFAVPQPIPLPDKTLFIKVLKDKALLAPSAEVLKQLEAAADAPVTKGSDLELLISMQAVKKLYGEQIDAALMIGARLAAGEEIDALKKLSEQIETIQKSLWDLSALELRLKFDQGSKNLHAELAVTPRKRTNLAKAFDNPPPGLEGKDTALLAANAPVNVAFRINGPAIFDALKEQNLEPAGAAMDIDKKTLEFYNGEFVLAASRHYALQSHRSTDGQPLPQKFDALFSSVLASLTQKFAADGGPDSPVLAPALESIQHKGVEIAIRKMNFRKKTGEVIDKDITGPYLAHATVNGAFVLGGGPKPEEALKNLIDAAQSNAPVAPEMKSAFDAPPPGTLVLLSAKLVEIVRLAAIETLADTVPPEQIVHDLADAPVFVSVFMHDGKAGLRVTLPGATTSSLYQIVRRLRGHGINVLELIGLGGAKPDNAKLPGGNVPPPPPPPPPRK